jgi:hypothetical protein
MGTLERLAQQEIPLTGSIVQVSARRSIVAKIGKGPGVRVKGIRPVWFGARCIKHDQLDSIPYRSADHPKATLVPNARQQSGQRIVAGISCRPTFVDAVNNQICVREFVELHRMGRKHPSILLTSGLRKVAARARVS